MSMIQSLLKEMDQEAATTRKMLERIPDDKYDWAPHQKSMSIRRLATHIAELPTWVPMVIKTDGLDFESNPYEPVVINNTKELLQYLEESLKSGREILAETTEKELEPNWTLSMGDQVLSSSTKGEMIRITYSQIVHHRAQLGVYLRLLNIPIPGSYGPSADEMN